MKVKTQFSLSPTEAQPEDEDFDEEGVLWTIDINPKSGNLNFKGADADGDVRWHWPNFPPSIKLREPMHKRLKAEGRRMPDGALK